MTIRAGTSLVELIVALTIFTVGLLGLAAAAALAQRSFGDAALIEHGSERLAAVIDSLLRVAEPAAGGATSGAVSIAWTVEADSTMRVLRVALSVRGVPSAVAVVEHSERAR